MDRDEKPISEEQFGSSMDADRRLEELRSARMGIPALELLRALEE